MSVGEIEELMTVKELSRIIRYRPKVVEKLARERKIPAYKNGTRTSPYRFRLSEVLEALRVKD